MSETSVNQISGKRFIDAPNLFIDVGGTNFVYRDLGAELVIYPDAGHGGIFQNHAAFVPRALSFLAA